MDLTVIICTRNRAGSLRRTLEMLTLARTLPGTIWELVIVDNGSTDNTAQVISSFTGMLPVRLVFAPQAGISNARNAGVAAARGEYIVWTDDDVDVAPEWLLAYQHAFKAWPAAAVFGGPISPLLEAPSPAWFAENMDLLHLLLASRDFGGFACPLCLQTDLIPFGANFAIRAAEQKQHRYDPAAGAGSENFRLGEEKAVIKQILLGGGTGYWVPGAAVRHRIGIARQSLTYVEDYFARLGRTVAYERKTSLEKSIQLSLLGHFLAIAINHGLLAVGKLLMPARIWLPRFMSRAFHRGAYSQLVEFRRA